MNIPWKIVMKCEKNRIPLTADIIDEKRHAIAYNMLCYMAMHGAKIIVDGKEMALEKKQLWIFTQGTIDTYYIQPYLDSEWFGSEVQKMNKKELYTVGNMCRDGSILLFAPMTKNYWKANEMNNFMLTAIDPAVSILYPMNGQLKSIVKNGRPINPCILKNDKLCTEWFEPNWVKTRNSLDGLILRKTVMKHAV